MGYLIDAPLLVLTDKHRRADEQIAAAQHLLRVMLADPLERGAVSSQWRELRPVLESGTMPMNATAEVLLAVLAVDGRLIGQEAELGLDLARRIGHPRVMGMAPTDDQKRRMLACIRDPARREALARTFAEAARLRADPPPRPFAEIYDLATPWLAARVEPPTGA